MQKMICDLIEKLSAMPRAALLIAAASLGSLGFAFTMQFVFGVEPCILCLWQRVPYGVAAGLALIAFFWKPYSKQTTALLALCTAAFLIGAGLATFHTGVEQHWWLGTAGCSITPLNATSPESLRLQLLHTVVAHCDEISWTFLGLSMANWNLPLSLGLAGFSGFAALKPRKQS